MYHHIPRISLNTQITPSSLSPEDHEPQATTPTHELDPGHMSGAEETTPTMNPPPAVVPSPDDSAKEVTEKEIEAETALQEEEEEVVVEEDEEEELLLGVGEEGKGQDCVGEGVTTERLDSVTIDPSYNPNGEELLYEGDIEAETTPLKPAPEKEQSTQDEGFIVSVHETSMELESRSSHSKTPTTTTITTSSSSSGSNKKFESKSSTHSSRHSVDVGGAKTTKTAPSSSKSGSSSETKKQESSPSASPSKAVGRLVDTI